MYKGTLMVAHLYLFKEQLKMTTKLYHPYPFPERWIAASLSGRSGGHPIGIVLLKKDIPDV